MTDDERCYDEAEPAPVFGVGTAREGRFVQRGVVRGAPVFDFELGSAKPWPVAAADKSERARTELPVPALPAGGR